MSQKPVLSIGMIFKNEIRCLERCMKSLQPLRDAIPCELVMADTGSTDGSREVAEKYADILIDFPWINDFAAARNAVIDRCSGEWHMAIDCDEWLGEDVSSLVEFMVKPCQENFAGFIIRNYKSRDLDGDDSYNDFPATRLFRMSTGTRYEGKIHEHYVYDSSAECITRMLTGMIVHHDGYMFEDPERAKQKAERNLTLLREKLDQEPDNLLLLLQCVESAYESEDVLEYARRGIAAMQEKKEKWEIFGPAILRYGIILAKGKNLPELDEWIEMAHSQFADSMFTRIDVEYIALGRAWDASRYDEVIVCGRNYLTAMEDYRAKRYDYAATMVSVFNFASPRWERNVKQMLASAYLYENQPENACELLSNMDLSRMTEKQAGDMLRILIKLHGLPGVNTAPMLLRFWEKLTEPIPSKERRDKRYHEVLRMSVDLFRTDYRRKEREKETFTSYAYTMFLAIEGDCILRTAAEALESEDPAVITEKLMQIEKWDELPVSVVEHAVMHGVSFPVVGTTLKLEELDDLAARLIRSGCDLFEIIRQTEKQEREDLQYLCWLRALVLIAVQTCEWNSEDGMELFRMFVRAEDRFLVHYYHAEILTEETVHLLSSWHRFGWYACHALTALDSGRATEYVQLLRKGFQMCPEAKKMVKFLVDHTEQLKPQVSSELLELAGKVRSILAMYAEDDPAVVALKQTPAYQQVAHLIEQPQQEERETYSIQIRS